MKKIYPLFSFLLVIALLISTVVASASPINKSVSLQETLSENVVQVDGCFSLDIVFLIDQSGSMSGDDGNPNDPLGNRFYAPRYAMNWLANNRLGQCPTAVHRIGVISFGTEVEVSLPLTVINPSVQVEWEEIRHELEQQISDLRMYTTDPLLAFNEAGKMLGNAPEQGELLRKTVIILLTDGQPCVLSRGCSYGNDKMDHSAYMSEMVDYINKTFPFSTALLNRENAIRQAVLKHGSIEAIPDEERNRILIDYPVTKADLASSTYVWMLAMNSVSDYLRDDGKYWHQITDPRGGELIDLQENLMEVPRRFNEILSFLEGITPIPTPCGNLAIDPYLAGAVFDIFKMADTLEVEILFNDKALKAGVGELEFFGVEQYSSFGAIEHYRFVQPPAGLWKVTASDCQGIEAEFITFKPKITYLSPTTDLPQYNLTGSNFDPDDPNNLIIRITDSNNQANLKLDPNYPLDFKAYITAPDGSEIIRTISFTTNGDWATDEPLPVDQIGTYKVRLFAKASCTYDPDRPNRCKDGEIIVVDDETGSYNVSETQPAKISIISPASGESLFLHAPLIPDKLEKLPVDLVVQLQAMDNLPLDWNSVLVSDTSSAVKAELTADGQTETITLSPDPVDNSLLSGSFTTLQVLGAQHISVTLVGEINKGQYQLQEKSVSVDFERRDSLLRDPRFYYVLLGLFILALIALIAKSIYDRTNIVLGKLQFINEVGPRDFSINRHRRVTVIKSGLPHELAVKKLVIRNDGELGGKRRISVHVFPIVGNDHTLSLIDSTSPLPITGTWRVLYVWGKFRVPKPQYPTKYRKY